MGVDRGLVGQEDKVRRLRVRAGKKRGDIGLVRSSSVIFGEYAVRLPIKLIL